MIFPLFLKQNGVYDGARTARPQKNLKMEKICVGEPPTFHLWSRTFRQPENTLGDCSPSLSRIQEKTDDACHRFHYFDELFHQKRSFGSHFNFAHLQTRLVQQQAKIAVLLVHINAGKHAHMVDVAAGA